MKWCLKIYLTIKFQMEERTRKKASTGLKSKFRWHKWQCEQKRGKRKEKGMNSRVRTGKNKYLVAC